jgi:hypothetical protein
METKLRGGKMEPIRCKLGFSNMFVVDCIGRSGGMALLWSENINVEIQNFSQRHINGMIEERSSGVPWKFTGFYGHPVPSKRYEAWALLRHLARLNPVPWVCVGDFNEIVELSEKWGGSSRPNSQMQAFQQVLECCHLSDLGFNGPKFTWTNCQEDSNFTKERLDRGVANSEWSSLFPEAVVNVSVAVNSDHTFLMLELLKSGVDRRRNTFRYEAKWELDDGHENVLKEAWHSPWQGANSWDLVGENLNSCKNNLLQWQRKIRWDGTKNMMQLQSRLQEIQEGEGDGEGGERKILQQQLQSLMDKEDVQWRQRAKIDWLRGGDRNTKFFHACATTRRRANQINSITDEAGHLCETKEEVQNAFVNYFTGLFSSNHAGDIDNCVQPIARCVTEEMNEELLKPFEVEEIHGALCQMGPLKAPGPDGFPAGFFQKNWKIMGRDICQAILSTLNSGVMPDGLNSTNIALIPKVNSPSTVSEFRPISLCNVMYKLISKVLANRLKKILANIISPVQSAFIPGRLITDNVLAAYETLHTMHSRLKGKKGFMAIKLDMSKAYDRVEWAYLKAVMRKMGFDSKWIRLIMMCVSTVQYSVLVNGQPCGVIKPERGLRQGDPISPYLFLICAEGLSALLSKATTDGILTGIPTSKRGPRISHLFFADDSLLFCRATLAQWESLTNILQLYEKASGQRLNNSKTSIFFSKNTPQGDRDALLERAGIPATQRYDTYLGLPALVGKSRISAFRSIIDRVWKRLQDWKLKFLSQAGKEVLLKSVIQAIPTYSMSVFLLPNATCGVNQFF